MIAGVLGSTIAWGVGFYLVALAFRHSVLVPPGFDPRLTPSAVAQRAWAGDPTLDQALAMPEWRAALYGFAQEWRAPATAAEIASLAIRLAALLAAALALIVPSAYLLEHAGRRALRARVQDPAIPRLAARDAFTGLAHRAFPPFMLLAGIATASLVSMLPYGWHAFDLTRGPPTSAITLGALTGACLGAVLGAPGIARRLLTPSPDRPPFCSRCGYRIERPGERCPECGHVPPGPFAHDDMRVLGSLGYAASRPARAALLALFPLLLLVLPALANAVLIASTGRGVGAIARFDPLARPGVEMPGLILPSGASLAVESDAFTGVVALDAAAPPGTLVFTPRTGPHVTATIGAEDRGRVALGPGQDVGVERRDRGVVLWFPGDIHSARFVASP
jgi:hypothetical protein